MLHAESSLDQQTDCVTKKGAVWFASPLGRPIAAVTATLLWGSAFPFVKMGYVSSGIRRHDAFAQILFAGYRFALAGLMLCLLAAALGHRPTPQTRGQATFAFRLSAIQTLLQYLFFYVGIALSSGISASILAGTLTFFQLVIAHVKHADDSLSVRKILSAVSGFAAIVAYHMNGTGPAWNFGLGELCILAAMFFAALGNVMNRASPVTGWSPLPLTGFQMLVGGLTLTAIGLVGGGTLGNTMSLEFVGILAYLSLASAISFLLWNTLMTYNKAGAVSVYLFLVPVFGVLLSTLILGEPLNSRVAPVLVVVVVSIFAAQYAKGDTRPSSLGQKSAK